MSGIDEKNAVQLPIVQRLVQLGWTHIPGWQLARSHEQVFIEDDLRAALARLNPAIAEDQARTEEMVPRLVEVTLASDDDGLVEANQRFAGWLNGSQHHEFVGTKGHVPVRLVDFDNPTANRLVVSDEVVFGTPGNQARFDIVLWVNGIPLVVGETKSPSSPNITWVKGAQDVHDHYEVERAPFFVPNVFSFASEGRELAYGALRTQPFMWMTWGATRKHPTLADVLVVVDHLLAPAMVLSMLRDFTFYETPADDDAGTPSLVKIVARYPQVEVTRLLHQRALDPARRRGLVYHTQGSGKTIAMLFTAVGLLRDRRLRNPTVIMVTDRRQLVRQVWSQFTNAGLERVKLPQSAAELRTMLADDQRGFIFTTVHKFADAGLLNDRSNIFVLVDESHRTQEGVLGQDMRRALPNATFFGFTGTPIKNDDHDTFALYGDAGDPGKVLHSYTSDQSIADGMTVPIHVNPRLVQFQLDKAALDEAFNELKAAEHLTEAEADTVAQRAADVSTFFANPERIRVVVADMLDHFYSTIDPTGMKAQIVVLDRAMCVAYHAEITRQLELMRRYDQAAVVMTLGSKDDPAWQQHALSDQEEEQLLKRFRTVGDPLKFLIVTSKLGTGFDAKIEGVLYLDKPLRDHTLFQTMARTNRVWRNPQTGFEKLYGLIVDYVGLGDGFAKAMKPNDPNAPTREVDLQGVIDSFEAQLDHTLLRFVGIDFDAPAAEFLMDAVLRIPEGPHRDRFFADFKMLHGLWETAWPDERLKPHRRTYKLLSQLFVSLFSGTPGAEERLWLRVGPKTLNLVYANISDVHVEGDNQELVVADAETIKRLVEEGLLDPDPAKQPRSAEEIVDSIAERLKRLLAGPNGDHPTVKSLAERLDALRKRHLAGAKANIEWLRDALKLATDLRNIEKADEASGQTGLALLDPNVGALTQIFEQYAPAGTSEIIALAVRDIDQIVRDVRYERWATTQKGNRLIRGNIRDVLDKHGLPIDGELFSQTYNYVASHY